MSDDIADKQHQASSKRLEDLRSKGQSLRSKDLTSGLVFIAAIIMLCFSADQFKTQLQSNFILSFTHMREIVHTNRFPTAIVSELARNNFIMIFPLFLLVVAIALLSPFVFGGWNFTLKPIRFKFETMNPISNLKSIYSKKLFLNIIKSMLKVFVILGVLSIFCFNRKNQIVGLFSLPVSKSIAMTYAITKDFIVIISSSLIVIILYDVITNFFEYNSKSKMSSQELKDENKDTEGNSDVKRKVRSMQFAIIRQRLSVTVPRATVIITNPTHYAVAIRYDANRDHAPRLIAKGKDYVAQRIKSIGIANGILIYPAPLLARAIYRTSKVNSEINPGLYMGVALILAYMHQLKNYQQGQAPLPELLTDLEIPKEFIFNE